MKMKMKFNPLLPAFEEVRAICLHSTHRLTYSCGLESLLGIRYRL